MRAALSEGNLENVSGTDDAGGQLHFGNGFAGNGTRSGTEPGHLWTAARCGAGQYATGGVGSGRQRSAHHGSGQLVCAVDHLSQT